MIKIFNRANFQRSLQEPKSHYWWGQMIFWFCLSVVPFLGMTLWYNKLQWLYIEHMFLQAALGLALSIPLGWLYLLVWRMPIVPRMVLVLALAGAAAAAWTWVRIYTYVWLTAEQQTWNEFGGWYFGAFYIFLCWSALYHGMRYYRLLEIEHQQRLRDVALTKEEQIKRLEAETIARDAQLRMLRYQINPHFLFNTLHAIYALIKTSQPDKAMGMTGKLGRFLRSTLDYDPAQCVSLATEIENIRLYLDIETVRFSDRLTIQYGVSNEALSARVPGLILQPLIENSIKYAIASSESGGTITINARVKKTQLFLEVIDSGPGIASTEQDDSGRSGIGLRNVLERLQALYNDEYSFDFESLSPHGLRVTVSMPFETSNSVSKVA
jgi:two-component system LytT family sensor kinase